MTNLRLLLADDEPRICTLVKNLIHWDALPLDLVGTASDGDTCLQMIRTLRPDIVISDIRMPGMSGLDIMKTCYEEALPVRFIIISGFTQFDYAYSAIKYGVEDFLLKPIGEQELNDALARLCAQLQSKTAPDASIDKSNSEAPSVLHRALLVALSKNELTQQDCTPENLERYFSLVFAHDGFLFGRLHLDSGGENGTYLYHFMEIFSRKLHDALDGQCDLVLDLPVDNQLLIFLHFYKGTQPVNCMPKLQRLLDDLRDTLAAYPFMRLTMAVTTRTKTTQDFPKAFSLTQTLCNCRFLLDTTRVIDDSALVLPLREMHAYPPTFKQAFLDEFKTLDTARCKALLRTLFREGMPSTYEHPYLLWEHTAQLGALALACFDSLFSLPKDYGSQLEAMKKELQNAASKDDLLNRLLSFFEGIVVQISSSLQSSEGRVIQTVKQYIQMHYSERLELEDVAKEVYLNPAYLGTFFKRETGMNFSDYLTSVRIEEAKHLLDDMQYNIGEIASKVGYKDANYFSRLFQKQVGIKPTEYRKLRHKQRLFR